MSSSTFDGIMNNYLLTAPALSYAENSEKQLIKRLKSEN